MPIQDLPTGTLLGFQADGTYRYRIERTIGMGGFGITYLAVDARLGGQVVIKELACESVSYRDSDRNTVRAATNQVATHEKLANKFLTEARTLRRLRSTHIVRVDDVFEANGTVYYSMDHVDAVGLLGQPRYDGPIQHPEGQRVLTNLLQLLEALAAVHELGIVHGDVKPENVLLDRRLGSVLIDFGTARSEVDLSKTATSMSFTVGYAPPELMHRSRIREVGPHSDLYSWGMLAYGAFLTHPDGEFPTDAYVRERSAHDPYGNIAQALLGRGLSNEWAAAIAACMALAPASRPPTANEVRGYLGGRGAAPQPHAARAVEQQPMAAVAPTPAHVPAPAPLHAPTRIESSAPLPSQPAASIERGPGRRRTGAIAAATLVALAAIVAVVVSTRSGGREATAEGGAPAAAPAPNAVPAGPAAGQVAAPTAVPPAVAPTGSCVFPSCTAAATAGAFTDAVYNRSNVWVYRVTRRATSPSRDEMGNLVYYLRSESGPQTNAQNRLLHIVRHDGYGDTSDRHYSSAGPGTVSLVQGGNGQVSTSAARAMQANGINFTAFGGVLNDGSDDPEPRETYFTPGVGVVRERQESSLYDMDRVAELELVAARVGSQSFGDLNIVTPECGESSKSFRARGFIANEWGTEFGNFDGVRVGSQSGISEIGISQADGTVSLSADGRALATFPNSRFHSAKAFDASNGSILMLLLDEPYNQASFYFITLQGGRISHTRQVRAAYRPGERLGIFRIPYQNECIYEIRHVGEDNAFTHVARLRDLGTTLQRIEGSVGLTGTVQ